MDKVESYRLSTKDYTIYVNESRFKRSLLHRSETQANSIGSEPYLIPEIPAGDGPMRSPVSFALYGSRAHFGRAPGFSLWCLDLLRERIFDRGYGRSGYGSTRALKIGSYIL